MSIAFYTGASGMRAYQNALDVTSHNIANLQTNGYKRRRPAFEDLLRSRMNTNVAGEHLTGHGVRQHYIDEIMAQGALQQTDYPLDFAIVGHGFFAVDHGGEIQYTRNGAFNLSIEGNTGTLVTDDGAYVLDRTGARIVVPVVNGQADLSSVRGRLAVYTFANPYGLVPQNNARYTPSDNSGAATLGVIGAPEDGGYTIVDQALEHSNVELAEQMAEVITSQRAYQLSARVVQTADNIMDIVNNLR